MSLIVCCSQGHYWLDETTRNPNSTSCCPTCGCQGQPVQEGAAVTAKVSLNIAGEPISLNVTVPNRPVARKELLPVFHAITEAVVASAVKKAQSQGEEISCKAGCGACCRQLVPITQVEARRILEVIQQMAEPRQADVRSRFAEASLRLDQAGVLAELNKPDEIPEQELQAFGLKYFHLGIACPFLKDESCSIYADRPIACREYLVTSPAENCAQPSAKTVRLVKLAGKVSNAVARLDHDSKASSTPWVPLIVAPQWAEKHPSEPPPRPAPELVQELFRLLTKN
jgi:Fe-S-cluster containining protein